MLKKRNNCGYTLVELLIVVSVVGILSGVVISLLNPTRTRNYAEEASLRTTIGKMCAGVEAYAAGEDELYPRAGAVANGNPLDPSALDSDRAEVYLSQWGTPYLYTVSVNRDRFSIHVPRLINNGFFKCGSELVNIRECASTTDNTNPADCD